MKFETPVNPNYAATVVTVRAVNTLEQCDFVVGLPVLGFQAIASKDVAVGEVGIAFTAETQLSEEYCKSNNLFRHQEKNSNPDEKGYLEDNRRVKAMKFRGHRSDCLFMPLTSLAYTGVDVSQLKDGDTFDVLNGHEICKKYEIKRGRPNTNEAKKVKTFVRASTLFLPEHQDTENYFRNERNIPDDAQIIVTVKVHGTSLRLGHTVVKRKLGIRDHIAKRLGVAVRDTEWDYIAGSRKVIKDPKSDKQYNHFYTSDIWSAQIDRFEGRLPEGIIVFAEIVGYLPDGGEIQKDYSYEQPANTCKILVYRIGHINVKGRMIDLTWDQTVQFCKENGIETVTELWRGEKGDFVVEDFVDKRFYDEGYTNALRLKKGLVDEGVVVRLDGELGFHAWKAKGAKFFLHESKMLDQETIDIEAEESVGVS